MKVVCKTVNNKGRHGWIGVFKKIAWRLVQDPKLSTSPKLNSFLWKIKKVRPFQLVLFF